MRLSPTHSSTSSPLPSPSLLTPSAPTIHLPIVCPLLTVDIPTDALDFDPAFNQLSRFNDDASNTVSPYHHHGLHEKSFSIKAHTLKPYSTRGLPTSAKIEDKRVAAGTSHRRLSNVLLLNYQPPVETNDRDASKGVTSTASLASQPPITPAQYWKDIPWAFNPTLTALDMPSPTRRHSSFTSPRSSLVPHARNESGVTGIATASAASDITILGSSGPIVGRTRESHSSTFALSLEDFLDENGKRASIFLPPPIANTRKRGGSVPHLLNSLGGIDEGVTFASPIDNADRTMNDRSLFTFGKPTTPRRHRRASTGEISLPDSLSTPRPVQKTTSKMLTHSIPPTTALPNTTPVSAAPDPTSSSPALNPSSIAPRPTRTASIRPLRRLASNFSLRQKFSSFLPTSSPEDTAHIHSLPLVTAKPRKDSVATHIRSNLGRDDQSFHSRTGSLNFRSLRDKLGAGRRPSTAPTFIPFSSVLNDGTASAPASSGLARVSTTSGHARSTAQTLTARPETGLPTRSSFSLLHRHKSNPLLTTTNTSTRSSAVQSSKPRSNFISRLFGKTRLEEMFAGNSASADVRKVDEDISHGKIRLPVISNSKDYQAQEPAATKFASPPTVSLELKTSPTFALVEDIWTSPLSSVSSISDVDSDADSPLSNVISTPQDTPAQLSTTLDTSRKDIATVNISRPSTIALSLGPLPSLPPLPNADLVGWSDLYVADRETPSSFRSMCSILAQGPEAGTASDDYFSKILSDTVENTDDQQGHRAGKGAPRSSVFELEDDEMECITSSTTSSTITHTETATTEACAHPLWSRPLRSELEGNEGEDHLSSEMESRLSSITYSTNDWFDTYSSNFDDVRRPWDRGEDGREDDSQTRSSGETTRAFHGCRPYSYAFALPHSRRSSGIAAQLDG